MANKRKNKVVSFINRYPLIKDIFLILLGFIIAKGFDYYENSKKYILQNAIVTYNDSNFQSVIETTHFLILKNIGSSSLKRIIIKSDSPNSYVSLFGGSSNHFNSYDNEIYLENLNPLEIECANILKDSTDLNVTADTDFELQTIDSKTVRRILNQYNPNVDTSKIIIKYLNMGSFSPEN
ncbi:MAG TPA: hypothetical protein PKA90_13685 [Ignavibacteria bacterium]|nr:hypothetical protein [Ignavibacteria bacterium]HMR41470.1 hypothetical protein [Ignavibacteria bacterium]